MKLMKLMKLLILKDQQLHIVQSIDQPSDFRADIHSHRYYDKARIKGKGRRVCLEDRIYSIPCHASCFALGRFEE